jgi:hypothetical protein
LHPQAEHPRTNDNALAIGKNSSVNDSLEIAIHEPVELDHKTKQEIFELRAAEVNKYPRLVSGDYSPSSAVFENIQDNLPWWGIAGQFFHDAGAKSIAGPAEESRFIMNPFLLAAPEFMGLSIWYSCCFKWNKNKITPTDLDRSDFPFICNPESLLWRPGESRAEVTYQLTDFLRRLNPWLEKPLAVDHAYFDLIAYNARDWNLNYIYVSYADSENISHPNPPQTALPIKHFLHAGGSCGYTGACNNMSPFTPEFSRLEISKLPAAVHIRLWKKQPAAVSDEPDMSFIIHII